jgi:4a-hydroxytetrahydrobiopterin dehydratase
MAIDTAPIDEGDKQKLTGQAIHDQAPPGWSKVLDRLVARFGTGDFNTGAALVTRIAEAADEMNHHPDVDLRYPHLTVSLKSHDVDAITPRDLRLAATISQIASEAGVEPAAHAPDVLEFALDTPDYERVKPFWAAILGYKSAAHPRDVVDPAGRTVNVWFQTADIEEGDSEAPDRQRWHVDVSVPREVAEDRIQAAVDAGGRLVSDEQAPAFWVLADPDGNKACICTWESRD